MLTLSILLAADPLLPVRILAAIALIAVIATFVHVLRHLREIERRAAAENLISTELGPRNNLVLIVCAIPIIVVGLLLFLIIKA
jgi:flagellar biogenesis protein FliO